MGHALRVWTPFRVRVNTTGLILALATDGLDQLFRYEAEHCYLPSVSAAACDVPPVYTVTVKGPGRCDSNHKVWRQRVLNPILSVIG